MLASYLEPIPDRRLANTQERADIFQCQPLLFVEQEKEPVFSIESRQGFVDRDTRIRAAGRHQGLMVFTDFINWDDFRSTRPEIVGNPTVNHRMDPRGKTSGRAESVLLNLPDRIGQDVLCHVLAVLSRNTAFTSDDLYSLAKLPIELAASFLVASANACHKVVVRHAS